MVEETYPPGYETARAVVKGFAERFNRMVVEGQEHIPGPGVGAMLCPNHDGYIDPMYLGAAIPGRYMRALGQDTVLNHPVVGKFLRNMGAVPVTSSYGKAVNKEAGAMAVKTLAEHLRQGELCLVFPEGVVKFWVDSDVLKRFRPGAVKAAAMASAPVIPVGIYGSRWAFPNMVYLKGEIPGGRRISRSIHAFGVLPVKVCIAFGEPMEVDPAAAEDQAVAIAEMARVRKAVFALRQSLKRRYFKNGKG